MPIRVRTKSRLKTFPKPNPGSELVVRVKDNSGTLCSILTDMNVDTIIPPFGSSLEECNDQADFIHVTQLAVMDVIEPNFYVLDESLGVK